MSVPDSSKKGEDLDVSTDKGFFNYLYRDLMREKIMHTSMVLSPSQWERFSGGTGGFFGRDKSIKSVDKLVHTYRDTVNLGVNMLRFCYLVCENKEGGGAQNQIDFSFPKFDHQVFQVGSFAVVSAWNLFSYSGVLALDEEVWQGALRSQSAAKELMQSSPDVSSMFESGKMKEAKAILHDASLEILHNISLASWIASMGNNSKLKSGIRCTWGSVMNHLPDLTKYPNNLKHLEKWKKIRYWFNPSHRKLADAVQTSVKNFPIFQRRPAEYGMEVCVETAYNNRLLFTPLRFFLFLKCLVAARSRSLQRLILELSELIRAKTVRGAKDKHLEHLKSLKEMCTREMDSLQMFSDRLPNEDHMVSTSNSVWTGQPASSKPLKKATPASTAPSTNPAEHHKPKAVTSSGRFPAHVPGESQKSLVSSSSSASADPTNPGENAEEAEPNERESETGIADFYLSSEPNAAGVLQGWLDLRSRHLQLWQKRWVFLQDTHLYFSAEKDDLSGSTDPPVDVLRFSSCTPSRLSGCSFVLASKDDALTFTASSKYERGRWMDALHQVIQRHGVRQSGVEWPLAVECGKVLGVELSREQALAVAPALGEVFKAWKVTTPLQRTVESSSR